MKGTPLSSKMTWTIVLSVLFVCLFSGRSFGQWVPRSLLQGAQSTVERPREAVVQKGGVASSAPATYFSTLTPGKIQQEKAYIASLPSADAKRFEAVLNYQLKPGQRFDNEGNIMIRLKSGKEVALMGYEEQKRWYEIHRKSQTPEWPEIRALKERIKAGKISILSIAQNIKNTAPINGAQLQPSSPIIIPPGGLSQSGSTSSSGDSQSGTSSEKQPQVFAAHPERQVQGPFAHIFDNLNVINPLFHQSDYAPDSLMYHAAELYQEGLFPFLPYLTPVRDQGGRGTCFAFAEVGAVELISMNQPDLSEQNYAYHVLVGDGGVLLNHWSVGLESDWPYDSYFCGRYKTGQYYSGLLHNWIPCSDTLHQGIFSNGEYQPYTPSMDHSEWGSCFEYQNLEFDPSIPNAALFALLLVFEKKPIVVGVCLGDQFDEIDGFAGEGFLQVDGPGTSRCAGHSMLLEAYIPRWRMPDEVKSNPDYRADEDYFIVKNSWSTWFGDGGFVYIPGSLLEAGTFEAAVYRYDKNSEWYSSCPPRDFDGVGGP